jgi:hypothetical protein
MSLSKDEEVELLTMSEKEVNRRDVTQQYAKTVEAASGIRIAGSE